MSKRIKILFTIPNFDTAGSGKVVYDLVKGLDKTVFEPEICCFHNKGTFFKTIESLGVKIHLFQFTIPYRPFITFPFRVFKIYKFFKRNQFDIIHSWHWSSDFSEPLAAKLAGIPFIYTKKAMGWGNKSWVWRSKLSTKIIVINEDMLLQFFGSMKHKVKQIPLGVDVLHFKPFPKKEISIEGFSINENDFVIVSVANLVPVKGIEVLLEVVKSINNAAIKTLIIGDYNNDYGKSLKQQYENEAIKFLGKQQDVRPYLALADVFVIPTKDEGRKEGMPIAPLEAMASENIVLGSNISGIKDILKQFRSCLFRPDDVSDLSDKILEIKKMSIIERDALSKRMRVYVEKELSLKQCILSHEVFYESLLKNKYAL